MIRHGVLPLAVATMALVDVHEGGRQGVLQRRGAAFSVFPARNEHRRSCGVAVPLQNIGVLAVSVVAVVGLQIVHQPHLDRQRRCRRRHRIPTVARILGVPVERMILYHVPHQRRARRARVGPGHRRSISPSSPVATRWGWRRSSPPSSAASTRSAAPSRAACCSGVVDNLCAAYVSTQYRAAVPLFILIVVILFRPQGLFGRAEERTV